MGKEARLRTAYRRKVAKIRVDPRSYQSAIAMRKDQEKPIVRKNFRVTDIDDAAKRAVQLKAKWPSRPSSFLDMGGSLSISTVGLNRDSGRCRKPLTAQRGAAAAWLRQRLMGRVLGGFERG